MSPETIEWMVLLLTTAHANVEEAATRAPMGSRYQERLYNIAEQIDGLCEDLEAGI